MVPSELIINEMNAFDEDGTMVAPDPVLTASQVSYSRRSSYGDSGSHTRKGEMTEIESISKISQEEKETLPAAEVNVKTEYATDCWWDSSS